MVRSSLLVSFLQKSLSFTRQAPFFLFSYFCYQDHEKIFPCNFLLCNLCLGGWAILQVPPRPGLVGHALTVTCRGRASPELHEVILFKDGVEVMRQNGLNPHFSLTNLTLEDQGLYSCRASWDTDTRTRSVISVETPVQVLGEFSYVGLHMMSLVVVAHVKSSKTFGKCTFFHTKMRKLIPIFLFNIPTARLSLAYHKHNGQLSS